MIILQDIQSAITHLNDHQTYPATKQELVKTCNELSDFSEEDKKWFAEKLPEGTYNSADEAIEALGWQKQAQGQHQGMAM